MRHRSITSVLLLIVFYLQSLPLSVAESVSYRGLALVVESREQTAPGLERITLFGEDFLVSTEEAGRRVAVRSLQRASADVPFSCDMGTRVLTRAIEAGDSEVAQEVMHAAGRGALCADDELQPLGISAQFVPVLAGVLAAVREGEKPNALLCKMYEESAQGGAATSVRPTQAVVDYCVEWSVQQALQSALSPGGLGRARGVLRIAGVSFAHSSSRQQEILARTASVLDALQHSMDKADWGAWKESRGRLAQLSRERLIDDERIARIDEQFLAAALDRGDLSASALCIAEMPFELRTPAMHEFVLQFIRQQTKQGIDFESYSISVPVVWQYAEKDEEILAAYQALQRSLERKVSFSGHQGRTRAVVVRVLLLISCGVALGMWIYRKRSKKRPDPSVSHDASSDEYAELLMVFGLAPGANISEIKNAYRRRIKKHHPDLRRGSEFDPGDFITLTKQYERLLYLQSNRGGSTDTE